MKSAIPQENQQDGTVARTACFPQEESSNIIENRLFWWVLLAAVLPLVVIALPLFRGKLYITRDLGNFHIPLRFFYAQSLAHGENFTWLPHLFCGFNLHGEGQAGLYHPLHLLLYRTLPFVVAFDLEFMLSYPMMLVGLFFFLRRWDLRRDAALFGACILTLSGSSLLHYTHMNVVAISAHIPWLLWTVDAVMRENDRRQVGAARLGIALLTTSQLLLGHPQYVWFSMLAEGLYTLFLLVYSSGSRRRVLGLIGAKSLGILGGGVQLLPSWDALSTSIRQNPPVAFLYTYSLHPANILQFIAPYLFSDRTVGYDTHEFSLYPGAMTTVLILWLLIRRKNLGALKPLAFFTLMLGLLSLWLALGEFGYLYRIQSRFPLIGLFRAPARYILLVHLAVAIASAMAFADLANFVADRERMPWHRLWPFAVLLGGSILLAGFGLWARPRLGQAVASTDQVLIGPVLVGLAIVAAVSALRGVRYALIGIIVFTAGDQGIYGISYIWRVPPIDLPAFIASELPPPAPHTHRILRARNRVLMQGWRIAEGYAGLFPKKYLDFSSMASLRVASIQWVRLNSATFIPSVNLFARRVGDWLEVPHVLARARLVTKAVKSDDPGRDIRTLDVDSTALVPFTLSLPEGTPGEINWVSDKPGEIELITNAPSQQLLVISESYDTGWQARVDGLVRPVLRVNGDFMGCLVDAGTHKVEWFFHPTSLDKGAVVSAIGIGLSVLWFVSVLLLYPRG